MTQIPILCFKCMNKISHRTAVCPNCGYNNAVRNNGRGMLAEGILDKRYLVGRYLGKGGFGITYIGLDLEHGWRVAIKEYYPARYVYRAGNGVTVAPLQGSEEHFFKGRERALKEGRMAAALGHISGVVQVYNTFVENNTVYIAMEYIHGGTLKEYVEGHPGRLTLQESLALLAPVAGALNKLHEQNIIHRDVKPENITVRKTVRQSVLLDFGAARMVDENKQSNTSAVVTAGYSPPEQYNNTGKIDAKMDQYAFAATLYYTLTGTRPPDAMERVAKSNQLPSICAANPTITPEKEKVIFKAMSFYAKDRYASIADMWWALRGAGNTEKSKKKMSAWKIVSIVLAVLLMMSVLGYFLWTGLGGKNLFFSNNTPKGHGLISKIETLFQETIIKKTKYGEMEFLVKGDTLTLIRYTGSDESVAIPSIYQGKRVIAVGDNAFYGNETIREIDNSQNIERIGQKTFAGCPSLERVTLHKKIKHISDNAFDNSPKVVLVVLPGSYAEEYARKQNMNMGYFSY